jgi:hypothetical protein
MREQQLNHLDAVPVLVEPQQRSQVEAVEARESTKPTANLSLLSGVKEDSRGGVQPISPDSRGLETHAAKAEGDSNPALSRLGAGKRPRAFVLKKLGAK